MYSIEDIKNTILLGDCIDIMRDIPSESIDLIITSPPYNLRNSSSKSMQMRNKSGKWKNNKLSEGYDNYNDCMSHTEYVSWQRNCIEEMLRLLKDTGAIFYNHKWRVQNGLMQDRHDILQGFPVRQIIIWQRSGGINFNDTYFLPTYEVIYMIAKPQFKLLPKANKHGDVWSINQERNNEHPAPFPIALPDKIIKSVDADLILDPFMGSGTTALAAIQNKRNYIGIDISDNYVKMAEDRIKNHMINEE